MGHQPYETWLTSEEPLIPEDEQKLQEHINTCESCRQLSYAWTEVQDLFREPQLAQPAPGFTHRWQSRFIEWQLRETERRQKRVSWTFFAAMIGAAFVLLGFMANQFFSSVEGPIQFFIGGLSLIAGILNLATAMQVALIPFLNVILVSVPIYWWLVLVIAACLLTLVLTFSARRILSSRRVSL
jgi:predicted anti-sigma-YlaC factor YlaD